MILAAFKCLLHAQDIDPEDPALHWEILHLQQQSEHLAMWLLCYAAKHALSHI